MATTKDLLSFLASLAEWMSAHQQHRSTIAGSNMKEFSVRIERSMLFSISVVASSFATNLLGGVVFEPHSPIFLELMVAS
jgi:hypothetical protein